MCVCVCVMTELGQCEIKSRQKNDLKFIFLSEIWKYDY